MFEAQLVIHKDAGNNYELFSPWFPGGGDAASFEVEVVEADGSPEFDIEVYTKTQGIAGDGAIAGTLWSQDGKGVAAHEVTGLKDLVRYRFIVNGVGSDVHAWTLFRMRAPRWYDALEA